VFWKRSHSAERRQQVLDELYGLEPAGRRARLDRAVAAGEVRAGEVDSTLRLVERLDALRFFTIHPDDPEADPAAEPGEGAALPVGMPIEAAVESTAEVETRPSVVAVAEPVTHRAPRNGPARPRRKRVGATVDPDPEQARSWMTTAAMPLDALEAASRLVARDKAARKTRRAGAAVVGGEVHAVIEDRPKKPAQAELPVSSSSEPAEPGADENWPSISWLRP
jgi:hypothetical protein